MTKGLHRLLITIMLLSVARIAHSMEESASTEIKEEKLLFIGEIKEIKKLVVAGKKIFILYGGDNNGDNNSVKNIPFYINFYVDNNFSEPKTLDLKVPENRDYDTGFCTDISSFENTYAYSVFFKNSKEQEGFFNQNKTSESYIYYVDNEGKITTIDDVHNTAIDSLFIDEVTIASHSTAGNIRVTSFGQLKSSKDDPKKLIPVPLKKKAIKINKSILDPKASALIAYEKGLAVVEEKNVLSGYSLYIDRIDNQRQIKKEICRYKKAKDYPCLVSINTKRIEADEENKFTKTAVEEKIAVYSQLSRSLTLYKIAEMPSMVSFAMNSDNYVRKLIKFSCVELPKALKYHVAKQIHYIDEKIILVYEEFIFSVDYKSNEGDNKRSKKFVLDLDKSKKLFDFRKSDDDSTIITTTLDRVKKVLWVIFSKQGNDNNPLYFIKQIPLENTKKE